MHAACEVVRPLFHGGKAACSAHTRHRCTSSQDVDSGSAALQTKGFLPLHTQDHDHEQQVLPKQGESISVPELYRTPFRDVRPFALGTGGKWSLSTKDGRRENHETMGDRSDSQPFCDAGPPGRRGDDHKRRSGHHLGRELHTESSDGLRRFRCAFHPGPCSRLHQAHDAVHRKQPLGSGRQPQLDGCYVHES